MLSHPEEKGAAVMTNRRIVTHLAFVMIAAAVVAEALAVSAVAASDASASLWTSTPLHEINFAAVATYHSAADYAAQILDTLSQLAR